MKELIFVLLFLIATSFAVYVIFKPVIENRKTCNNVMNYDTFMNRFYFELTGDAQQAVKQLSIHNVQDVLEYEFDSKSSNIRFMKHGTKKDYVISFTYFDGKQYMKVEQTTHLYGKNTIPYKVNTFFVKKLNAKPVGYTEINLKQTKGLKF